MRPKFEETILLSSSRAFLLSTSMENSTFVQHYRAFQLSISTFQLSSFIENREATWKKSYKMQQKKSLLSYYIYCGIRIELTGECKHISSSTTGLLLKNQLCNILDDDKSCRRLAAATATAAASPPLPLLAAPLSAAFLAPRRRNQTVFSGRRIARVTLHIVHKSQLMFRKCKIYQRVI